MESNSVDPLVRPSSPSSPFPRSHHSPQQLAAGYEGTSGLITTLLGLLILNRFIGQTPAGKGGYFDAPEGWRQIVENAPVLWSSVVIAFR